MHEAAPREELLAVIELYCPKGPSAGGRPPVGLARMLRIQCLPASALYSIHRCASRRCPKRIRMRALSLFCVLAFFVIPSYATDSSFGTVRFSNVARIDLPRNWTYLDKEIAAQLNTSSEATGRILGIPINQGDNTILVAGNASDGKGKPRATIRLSVRARPSPSQQQFRELAKQSPQLIREALLPVARETADAMLMIPGIKSYKVVGVKLDTNGELHCARLSFESEYSDRVVISDTWLCPLSNRAIKLSSSYDKRYQAIYWPIIEYVWRSLSEK